MAVISDQRAIALFLDMLASERGAAANTLAAYGRDLTAASEALAGRLAVADVAGLQQLFAGWDSYAASTIARRRAALRRFFAFLLAEGLRLDNPARQLAAVKPGRPLPKTLSVADVDHMFDALALLEREQPGPRQVRLRALMELLYGSGLRATELVSLPRNAIRPPQPFAIITGKGDKQRLVPLSPAALRAVEAQLVQVPAISPYLFPSGKGHLSRIRLYQLIKALAAAAGISAARVSPHVLRHAFATHMLANGADLRALQALLGHADISTTERYTHISNNQLAQTVERLHPLAGGTGHGSD